MPNLLTAQAGLKLGPILIETFFKHYLERVSETTKTNGSERSGSNSLREQDLLWQESFEIIKSFLNQATKHTVEELQEFSNARIPSPPWIYVHRVLVPLSTCDTAATYLIKALGGEAFTTRVVGGTKWWQVRGMRGVDCQWICQKSHMRTSRRRHKARERTGSEDPDSPSNALFSVFRKSSSPFEISNSEPHSREDSGHNNQQEYQNNNEEKNMSQESLGGLDGTRCMLYAHGGGYYFGSVDQERYCLQRYARKIKGRVFAVNYRLAPQYPFPCAIHDMLAAYLYLIEPPPDAMHAPIPPNLIVLGGDSAGGGLCLAILQVMRDSGIPLPAGAVLISPWCDLTHSFPSTLQNTETDIIPRFGLCLHKPSVLWPPPPDEISSVVRANLRERFKAVAKKAVHVETFLKPSGFPSHPQVVDVKVEKTVQMSSDLGTDTTNQLPTRAISPILLESEASNASLEAPGTLGDTIVTDEQHMIPKLPVVVTPASSGRPPLPWEPSQSLKILVDDEVVTVDSQIQLYCPNNLLTHPLVSPVMGYLGGLPPLLVIASDKEVLRDEIVYLAHKAARPDQFHVNEDARMLYPPLQHITTSLYSSTPVHLQVYDETAHVLPLFSFTTPAKYCYRAIAAFTKHLTPISEPSEPQTPVVSPSVTPEIEKPPDTSPDDQSSRPHISITPTFNLQRQSSPSELPDGSSPVESRTSFFKRNTSATKTQQASEGVLMNRGDVVKEDSGDVAGSRFKTGDQPQGPGTAGNPLAYADTKWPSEGVMIRERVSTHGVLRPFESESEMLILKISPDHIGRINENVARRYLKGRDMWAKKFNQTAKTIETRRKKNLELAKCETIRTVQSMAQLQEHLFREHDAMVTDSHLHKGALTSRKSKKSQWDEADAERQSWMWSWALDGEHPPPSSIVSRRDTVEARDLARVADLSVEQEDSKLSGNMLWSVLVNFLTARPSHKQERADEDEEDDGNHGNDNPKPSSIDKVTPRKRSQLFRRLRSLGGRQHEPGLAEGPST